MSLEFSVKVEGFKELEAALNELPKSMAKSALVSAYKKVAKPLLATAKANVPVRRGQLKDSLEIGTKLKSTQRQFQAKTGTAVVYVGATWPKGAHAHLVEFGTRARTIKIKHKKILSDKTTVFGTEVVQGPTPPHPFLRPAWDSHKNQILKDFGAELWKILARKAQTLARKAAKGTLGARTVRELTSR